VKHHLTHPIAALAGRAERGAGLPIITEYRQRAIEAQGGMSLRSAMRAHQ